MKLFSIPEHGRNRLLPTSAVSSCSQAGGAASSDTKRAASQGALPRSRPRSARTTWTIGGPRSSFKPLFFDESFSALLYMSLKRSFCGAFGAGLHDHARGDLVHVQASQEGQKPPQPRFVAPLGPWPSM